MASLARVTINWSGFAGAPGYTNLYFRNATPGIIDQSVVDNALTKVDAWIAAYRPSMPQVVTTVVSPTVEEIADSTGHLVAVWSGTTAAAAAGADAGAYAAAAGACVNWYTNTIRNTRRMRGRSFVVPLGTTAWQSDGTLATAKLTTFRTANDALRAASGAARLVVWGRPSTPGGTDGVSAEVLSSTLADKSAVLTSRRD